MKGTEMRVHMGLIAAVAALCLSGAEVSAKELNYWPYATKHNFCPPGLQPVTAGGIICCGKPNQHITYQQAMRHPTATVTRVRHVRADDCPAGAKGCR
jgi:hypothetical protein